MPSPYSSRIFPVLHVGRICINLNSTALWWSFPIFSCPVLLTNEWYGNEKLEVVNNIFFLNLFFRLLLHRGQFYDILFNTQGTKIAVQSSISKIRNWIVFRFLSVLTNTASQDVIKIYLRWKSVCRNLADNRRSWIFHSMLSELSSTKRTWTLKCVESLNMFSWLRLVWLILLLISSDTTTSR